MPSSKLHKSLNAEALFGQAERYEEKGYFGKAFDCLSAAARQGHAGGQLNLGNYYAWGRGVRRDLEKAAYWYKKAYRNGDSNGALNLAIDRRKQGKLRSAVIWFKKAIAMNNGDAHIALAKVFTTRKGGHKAATRLLRRALRLSKSDISTAAKDEADSLLREIGETRER